MSIFVSNTLTGRKEELLTRDPGRVGIYVCGPTVYNHIHVGNARAFVIFDVIRKYLCWRGYEVLFVQNYTDIDDKIIDAARRLGLSWEEVANSYSRSFEEVMDALGVDPPDILCRATQHVPQMIEMIEGLIKRDLAYAVGGDVYFAVQGFEGYGKLSGRRLESMDARERVEPDPQKRYPFDFALWKSAKAGEPSWESPWGPGRPGWHIECSAMALAHLGLGFDIHGGGQDLIFPHHENEIAQAEGYSGQGPFVRYWLHNGLVTMDEEKMSKSAGNVVLLKDLIQQAPAAAIRLLSLGAHWRSSVSFGQTQLSEAVRTYGRLQIFENNVSRLPQEDSSPDEDHLQAFRACMDDDFNTHQALVVLHDLVRVANSHMHMAQQADVAAVKKVRSLHNAFVQITEVLGVRPSDASWKAPDLLDGVIELALELRDEARAKLDFSKADDIRGRLETLGIVIEDTPGGSRWRLPSGS